MAEQDSETITDPLTLLWKQRINLLVRVMNFFGLPLILLVLIALGVRSFWFWSTPLAEAIAKQHIETLKEMSDTQISIAGSIGKISDNGKELIQVQKDHRDVTAAIAKQLNEVHDVIVRKPTAAKD